MLNASLLTEVLDNVEILSKFLVHDLESLCQARKNGLVFGFGLVTVNFIRKCYFGGQHVLSCRESELQRHFFFIQKLLFEVNHFYDISLWVQCVTKCCIFLSLFCVALFPSHLCGRTFHPLVWISVTLSLCCSHNSCRFLYWPLCYMQADYYCHLPF